VPHPAVVVIDREGIVRRLHVDPDYRVRPSADDVLDWLEGASVPMTRPGAPPLPDE
jgi:peroxiredoxin